MSGRPEIYSASDVLNVLPNEGLTTKEWARRCRSKLGISHARFAQKVQELIAMNRIKRTVLPDNSKFKNGGIKPILNCPA
jgi:hypothetical protein